MDKNIYPATDLMDSMRKTLQLKGKKYITSNIRELLELLDGSGIVITDEDLIASTLLENNMWINSEVRIEVGS